MVGWRYAGPFDDLPAVRTRSPRFGRRARRAVRAPGRRLDRGRRGRGDRHRPRRPGLRRRGLPARQVARAAGRRAARRVRDLPRRVRLAVRSRRPRRRRADRRAPQARGSLLPARDDRPPLSALLALRHAARLPPRRRVVHQHGSAVRPAARDADHGAGRRQPALPDHGRRRPDPLDPGLRLRARARLAPQHARLDDQQEALLGTGAADLRLRGVRHGRGHRRSRGAARSARSRAGRRSRVTRRTGRTSTRSRIACPGLRRAGRAHQGRRQPVARRRASCRSRRSTSARIPTTGASGSRPTSSPRASPASSATGSTRCWRCARCSAASRRSRRSSATPCVFGEDGRQMHKSWGNAIEFDEAADRMGVDVMRWMFAKARPEENILFGWHAADEARRELLVLWNVYAFFVTYARLAGWSPTETRAAGRRTGRSSTAGSCRARPGPRPTLEARLLDVDAVGATRALSAYLDDLSTWYLRLSRDASRARTIRPTGTRPSPRSTRRSSSSVADAGPDPAVPGRVAVRQPDRRRCVPDAARQRPPDARGRRPSWPATGTRRLEAADGHAQRRGRAGADAPQPRPISRPASRWRPPGSRCRTAGSLDRGGPAPAHRRARSTSRRSCSSTTTPSSSSGASSRSCRRSAARLGAAIPRSWPPPGPATSTYRSRRLGDAGRGHAGADEVEIQATPRPGTAVAHHDGLVVVLDTALTPELVAEGDARELAAGRPGPAARGGPRARRPDRAVGRCAAGGRRAAPARRSPPTRSPSWATGEPPPDARRATVELDGGPVGIALRRRPGGA